ncbi:MAG: PH domain-containing protein [Candidatus Moraniibacteriota bacterium]
MQPLDNFLSTEEKVLKVSHRHWFDILMHFASIIALMGMVFLSFVALPAFFPDLLASEYGRFFLFIENTIVLLSWIYFFLIWIDVWFDTWIITDDRIINIEQSGLFSREVSELKLARVQDVSVEVHGFFQTFLNYGDVHIQSAGEEERFQFRSVPDPYGVKNIIMNHVRTYGNKHPDQQ